ncbi:TAGL1C [Auxenochlorella protothecoides x Auxenochlorella symbiontica]
MAESHPDTVRGGVWPTWPSLLRVSCDSRPMLRQLRGLAALYLLLGRSLSSIALELVRHIRQAGGVLKSLSLGGRLVYRGVEIKRWHGLVAAYLAYKAAQALQGIIKYLAQTGQRRTLRRRMRSASSYEEWQGLAREWDRLTGAKAKPCLTACEAAELRELSGKLREARLAGDLTALRFTLRMDLKRRSGYEAVQRLLDTGIQCITLPAEVEEYLSEAIQALQHIVGTPALVHRGKVSFFRELRHAYGRTALVLSGGGSFGFFHYGVIKVLLNAGILPRIVAGSSAGALGAGILASRPVAQLAALVNMFPGDLDMNLLSNNTTPHILRHLVVKGTAQDGSVFVERLKRLYGADLTFADAYAVSGRILNVSVCAADTREPPRVLNYLSAPSVLVWSAVACSSAFPWLFAPRELLARDPHGATVPLGAVGGGGGAALPRRWRDGSLELDLPMRELGETFNVNYSIVSQANPWLLPVIAAQRLLPAGLGRALETEFKHRCGQALTFFPRSPLLKMVGQPWGGHVTLAMPAAAFGAGQAARNLSPADIARAVREGQLRAWRALPVMHAACAVEAAIDAALAQLLAPSDSRDGAATAQHPLPRKIPRASLPSWLHLPALGLPPSASLEHELGAHGSLAASLASLDEEAGEAGGSPLADAAPDAPMSYAAGDVAAAEHVWRDLAELSTRSHSALDCIAP